MKIHRTILPFLLAVLAVFLFSCSGQRKSEEGGEQMEIVNPLLGKWKVTGLEKTGVSVPEHRLTQVWFEFFDNDSVIVTDDSGSKRRPYKFYPGDGDSIRPYWIDLYQGEDAKIEILESSESRIVATSRTMDGDRFKITLSRVKD